MKDEFLVPGLELTILDVQVGTQILLQASICITTYKQYSYACLYWNNEPTAQGDAAGELGEQEGQGVAGPSGEQGMQGYGTASTGTF